MTHGLQKQIAAVRMIKIDEHGRRMKQGRGKYEGSSSNTDNMSPHARTIYPYQQRCCKKKAEKEKKMNKHASVKRFYLDTQSDFILTMRDLRRESLFNESEKRSRKLVQERADW
jgi:hypothetical protein